MRIASFLRHGGKALTMDPFKRLAIDLLSRQRNLKRAASLFRVVSRSLGLGGNLDFHQSGEAHFLGRYLASLRVDPVVLDVGANRGHYSLLVLAIKPNAKVIAFEPNPELASLLDGIGNPRLKVIHVACSDFDGEATLYTNGQEQGSGIATMLPESLDLHQVVKVVQHKVPALRLEGFLRQQGLERIDLLKIDTEGHELKVLAGLGTAIERRTIGCVQFEFNAAHALARTFLRDFQGVLAGYGFFRLTPHGMVDLGAYRPETWELFQQQNIVALLPEVLEGMRHGN
jgi:FkbM family methyltransferase